MRPTFRQDVSGETAVAAGWLGTRPECTLITEGAHHGSLIAMLAGRFAGRPVAVDAAAYSGALEQARALGCPLVGCAIDAEGMLPESLRGHCERAAAAGEPIAGLFLTVTVHNPLGFVASEGRRRALVAVARAFDLLILEDDTYGFMEPAPPPRLAELAPERTFLITSLSKIYAPAARTGFLAVPEGYVEAAKAMLKCTTTGSSSVHNAAAVSLIKDGSLERVREAKLEEGARRNEAARAVLGDRCRPGARCAWHLWVELPTAVTPAWFEERMAGLGVAVSGGNWFAVGDDAPHGFRIALGGEVDGAATQRGVASVAEELARLP